MKFKGKNIYAVFIVIILCLGSAVSAQVIFNWEFAGWYGGGCYPNVVFDPHIQGRLYLVSDVAGIWRSDNWGDQWYSVNKGLTHLNVTDVAVAPSDSNVVYVATAKGIFVSQDAGANWQAADSLNGQMVFSRPEGYRAIAVHPNSPNVVCAGTKKGMIVCSTTYGAAWENVDPLSEKFLANQPITVLAFNADGSELYAASLTRMGKYSLPTHSWMMFPLAPQNITDFVISNRNPSLIYAAGSRMLWMSPDGGTTWQSSTPISQGTIYRLALDESGMTGKLRTAWNKGWNSGILTTVNSGKTWSVTAKIMQPDLLADPTRAWYGPAGKTTAFKIDPFNPETMLRTDWWGVWRSNDGGISWQEKIVGAANVVGSDIAVNSRNEVYVATMDNGLLKSPDGGMTYQAVFPGPATDPDRNGHVWRVRLLDDLNIIATSSPWDRDLNQVILSHDGGKTFSLVRGGLPEKRPRVNTLWGQGYPRALAVDPKDPRRIYLGIDGDDGGGLFVSADAGATWSRSAVQPGSLRIYNALAVDPIDSNTIYWGACGVKGGVYFSKDQGQTWSNSLLGMNCVFDLTVGSDGTVYAAGDYGGPAVFVWANGQWKLVKKFPGPGAAEAIVIDPANPNRIALSTVRWNNDAPGKIYLSQYQGQNWIDLTGDLPDGSGAASMTFSPDGSYLYLTRYAGTAYRIRLP